MQSFKDFITEESSIEKVVNSVISDCMPFLQAIDGEVNNYKMFRGMKGSVDFIDKKVRGDRKPNATVTEVHDMIDNYFENKFGIPFRSQSIFTTSSERTAQIYGRPYLIFPKGDFKFIWSPKYEDLYHELPKPFRLANSSVEYEEMTDEEKQEQLNNFLDKGNYQTTSLKEAINSENEIMIHTNDYYAVSLDFFEDARLDDELEDAYEFYS